MPGFNLPIPPDFPLARFIDQTILRPTAGPEEVRAAAHRAVRLGFAALCLPPFLVGEIAPILAGTEVALCTVIGFPLGFHTVRTKVFETEEAVARGAGEIDFVANRAWVRSGRYDLVGEEIGSVVKAAGAASVKVIMETSDLSLDEQFHVCDAAIEAGAAFVKTSTGFFGAGADLEGVRALKAHAAGRIRIKASGGIRDLAAAWAFIRAGADRIGASSGESIMNQRESLD